MTPSSLPTDDAEKTYLTLIPSLPRNNVSNDARPPQFVQLNIHHKTVLRDRQEDVLMPILNFMVVQGDYLKAGWSGKV